MWAMMSIVGIPGKLSDKRNFTVKAMNVTPAIVYPALLITPAKPFNWICKGVSISLSICEPSYTLPYPVASPTFSTCMTPCPSTTVVPRMTTLDG